MLWKTFDFTKVIVIGDVHGHLNTLLALISKLEKEYPGIPIFFLGDLIDKGKRSKEVVELVKEKYYSVLGNHDHFMTIESRPTWKKYESLWLINSGAMTHRSYGGKWKLRNYREKRMDFMDHVNWIKELPLVAHMPNIKVNGKEVYLSHAGIDKAIEMTDGIDKLKELILKHSREELLGEHLKDATSFESQVATNILWNVLKDAKSITDNGIFNVVGHTSHDEVVLTNNIAGIDTCVYGPNKLTALVLPDMKIISQETLSDTWGEKKA